MPPYAPWRRGHQACATYELLNIDTQTARLKNQNSNKIERTASGLRVKLTYKAVLYRSKE
jgi:hypothetical protein